MKDLFKAKMSFKSNSYEIEKFQTFIKSTESTIKDLKEMQRYKKNQQIPNKQLKIKIE